MGKQLIAGHMWLLFTVPKALSGFILTIEYSAVLRINSIFMPYFFITN